MTDTTPTNAKVYLETTVISYLTSRRSRDVVAAGRQELTREWWEKERHRFRLLISDLVLDEAGAGDRAAAERRLNILAGIDVLPVSQTAEAVAAEMIRRGLVPASAPNDALHIGICVVNTVEYLLTWNCAHIANAEIRRGVDEVAIALGYRPTVLCTPEELFRGWGSEHA
ncbi:MAG: type II toxin-antitoxin system VapC family toxin [Planctomycetes bacterium]|nr:type II toxin-antitoxin system VapC family toxin [Planctomycetota bacterium]